MSEETHQHISAETPLNGEQVVLMGPADYPVGNVSGVAPLPLATARAWQVGQGYGNQVGEYDVQPMTEYTVTEGDFTPHEDLSYVVNPMAAVTMARVPALESNEAPAENVFVINSDRLASMSDAERQVYLRDMVVLMYQAKEQMCTEWEEYKRQNENDPKLVASIKQSEELQAVIDDNRKDMEATAPPEESLSGEAKKRSWFLKISDALYKAGAEFAPQLVLSAALVLGAAGTAAEAHENPYGTIGARHEASRAKIADRYEDQRERVAEQFDAKRNRFNQQYVRDKQALYDRHAPQSQIDVFERVTSENFAILVQQRKDALNTTERKFNLAKQHDMREEKREMRDADTTVGSHQ